MHQPRRPDIVRAVSGPVRASAAQIRWFRQRRSGLVRRLPSPVASARRLLGVQAQLAPAASLAFWNRTADCTAEALEEARVRHRTLVRMWGQRNTVHVYDATVCARQLTVVYSGDTVVDRDTWRDSALSYCWMGAIDYLRRLHGCRSLYWFLLVSGFRTYRFLPVYSKAFYPRFDEPTPASIQRIMDQLATQRFGDRYDARLGIVRLAVPAILREAFQGIPEHRLADPHIAFFARRNPGHEQGDELVCFTELTPEKMTRLGQRMWRRGSELFRTKSKP